MGFVTGLVIGLVAGAGGAVYYSLQTGRDLREEFGQIRSELQQRDFEALGSHLEDRFKELQASLEERLSQAGKTAGSAAKDVAEDAASAAEEAPPA
jgi:gas vesicle protein